MIKTENIDFANRTRKVSFEISEAEIAFAERNIYTRVQKELVDYFIQNFLFKHEGKLMQSLVDKVNEGFLAEEVVKEVASIIAKRIMKEHVEEKK